MKRRFLIVGGSYAACQMAVSAREHGYDGEIFMISEESELPYHRPPLSKAFLKAEDGVRPLPLKSEAFYREHGIEVLLGTKVERIDRASQSLDLNAGSMTFDHLGLATGARARKIETPGRELAGIFYLRSLDDALALREAAAGAERIVVLGGGFIGLEVASALARRGKAVTILEAQERPLARAVAAVTSNALVKEHEANGVSVIARSSVSEIVGDRGGVTAVVCSDGTSLEADLVLVGIGALPNCELAEAAGLTCQNGIVVDRFSRASDPAIVVAGDCAFYAGPFTPAGARLESVQNATDQARSAGATVAGTPRAYAALPWFWSDQYDLKLQIAGLSIDYDDVVEQRFANSKELNVFYFKSGVWTSLDSINRPRDHMLARRLLSTRMTVLRDDLEKSLFDLSRVGAALERIDV